MTYSQMIITVAALALATVLTRSLPFIVFSKKATLPKFIEFLGKALPPAVFAMLLVYCLKSTPILTSPHGIPELLALTVVVILHLLRRQMLLSIGAGTIFYMFLLQFIF